MTELIKKYNEIMDNYRSGKYGNKHLTVEEIFIAAGEPDLFDRMSIEELEYLRDNATGLNRLMFCYAVNARKQ